MRRREFIALVAGAAAWPVAAWAQRDSQRLVGVVSGYSEAEMRAPLTAFRSKLNQLGWTEGRNLAIDARLATGDYRRMTAEPEHSSPKSRRHRRAGHAWADRGTSAYH
jgi:putative ABC transport system substrate-binding protein